MAIINRSVSAFANEYVTLFAVSCHVVIVVKTARGFRTGIKKSGTWRTFRLPTFGRNCCVSYVTRTARFQKGNEGYYCRAVFHARSSYFNEEKRRVRYIIRSTCTLLFETKNVACDYESAAYSDLSKKEAIYEYYAISTKYTRISVLSDIYISFFKYV